MRQNSRTKIIFKRINKNVKYKKVENDEKN